ncbi:MAG: NAD-dependent protein deacylase [Clostridia bacterium]|nr:NAD-dependent protein deacylase [Clostridia bacterium]
MHEKLKEYVTAAKKIVFLGGAGVSTESGIPDFRGGGIQSEIPFETILSHDYLLRRPREFYDFYKSHMLWPNAAPNAAHKTLARLEAEGKLIAVITQNIDGLHQKAGSKNVIELHGTVERNYCVRCGKEYSLDYILKSEGVPVCSCGAMVRPDVVMYGEGLSDKNISDAISAIRAADLMIIGGTSLVVYPAAGLVRYFNGNRLVIINMSPTQHDKNADLLIAQPIGQALGD